MDANKKDVAEGQTQEQKNPTCKDLETIALQIFTIICSNKLSTHNANEVLKYCDRLIDLNSQIVIENGKVNVNPCSSLL